MKYKKSVYRSLTLITQFGINMLVPIFLCVMAGIWLGRKFSIEWITIPLFAIGALAGFRNIFIMAKKIYGSEDTDRSDKEEKNHAEKD
ncbi:MAG: AtpZ/AtpI family protein [Lachnospiraceae bacterium]|nr:AtpZ/AtpI family protein [Lachnospiraceae bacterium]